MSVANKMTYAQVVSELSGVTYSKAIDHYSALRNSFLTQYSLAAQESVAEISKIFQEEIINEINQEGIEEQEKLADELFSQVRDAVIMQLEGNSSLQKLRSNLIEQNKNKKNKGTEEFQRGLNEILSEEKLKELTLESLRKYGGSENGFDPIDIINQVRSYRNQLILVRTNKSAKYYKRSTKGYFREALVHKAFSHLSQHLDGKISNISTGSMKIGGKDTVYDEFIDLFNNVEGSFHQTVTEQFDSNTGFGIQSKSWIAPWEKNENNPYARYGMSGQAQLFNYLTTLNYGCNTWSWIKGVQFLEGYLISAIGPRQVGFVTGKNFYWTGELIANFRQMNYFYAFIFNNSHKATSSTSWQTVNMNA